MQPVDVLIPCRNEAVTIGPLVAAFRAEGARVVVCDNASTDDTAARAAAAGAEVVVEPRPGKGHAVRRLLGEARAPVCVMVDGDGTYPAAALGALTAPILAGRAEMVVGRRRPTAGALTPVRRLGNHLFTGGFRLAFGDAGADLLSGYRAFSRAHLGAVTLTAAGFEIEAELAWHAGRARWRVVDVDVPYAPRPVGSASKLVPAADGARILCFLLGRAVRPGAYSGVKRSVASS